MFHFETSAFLVEIDAKLVQSTVIFVANLIRFLKGAAHRNLIIFRCAAPFVHCFRDGYKY